MHGSCRSVRLREHFEAPRRQKPPLLATRRGGRVLADRAVRGACRPRWRWHRRLDEAGGHEQAAHRGAAPDGESSELFRGGVMGKHVITSGTLVRLEFFDWGVRLRGTAISRWVVPTWEARYDELAIAELVSLPASRIAVWFRLRGGDPQHDRLPVRPQLRSTPAARASRRACQQGRHQDQERERALRIARLSGPPAAVSYYPRY